MEGDSAVNLTEREIERMIGRTKLKNQKGHIFHHKLKRLLYDDLSTVYDFSDSVS